MKSFILGVSFVVATTLSGCAGMSSGEQRTLSGAAIGAGTGAAIGAISGGSVGTGAAIGAGAGALGGYLYDRHRKSQGRY